MAANRRAWWIWSTADEFARQFHGFGGVLHIDMNVVISLCGSYGDGKRDFDKVLVIERILYPTIVEKHSKAGKSEGEQESTIDRLKSLHI